MHPSTSKGIDFGRRCSHCIAEVGREKLSACSRCKRARYCSKACQRAAWESHKPNCKSVADARAEVHPDSISSYVVLDAALTKWSRHWTFALYRWACVGMDLTNQSPDRAATHCCLVRLKLRPNPPTPAHAFVMTSAEIMSNKDFLKALWIEIGPTREDFAREQKKTRPNNRMSLVIFCEGLANYHYFTIDTAETIGYSSPSISKAAAEIWAENLIRIVETGDASKENSDKHLLRTISDIAALPGVTITTM
ncbi:hypothetical protein PILCRDRAFT_824604 [Piloderma croceum F 1598]|uniref:MYND-type domain-containing protein n=1 Tax=Piloderma croceum (strain F 1598) TaxID=765440 RepID=A0A0C3AWK6_PILCF|nr:hypothetical protein PILCRDRAFT_824604 [Piloderma croceum F 1598]